MNKRIIVIGLALLIMGIWPTWCSGGIKVSPGAFCLQGIDAGVDQDLGIDLTIYNISDEEQVFVVRSLKPSEATEKWLRGYTEIPDANWFYFNENRITIGPNAQGKLRMHLKIPDEEKYLNQHWIVYVRVTTEETKMFKAALIPCYMIETEPERDIKEKPYGILSLVPSIVKIEEVIPGEKRTATFKIYNNDEVEHTYTLTPYIPLSKDKLDISLSPGYEWAKDKNWVKLAKNWWELGEKQIKLKPGEVKDVTIEVSIPEGSQPRNNGWENIILVEPDEGLTGFVRVWMEMIEE